MLARRSGASAVLRAPRACVSRSVSTMGVLPEAPPVIALDERAYTIVSSGIPANPGESWDGERSRANVIRTARFVCIYLCGRTAGIRGGASWYRYRRTNAEYESGDGRETRIRDELLRLRLRIVDGDGA